MGTIRRVTVDVLVPGGVVRGRREGDLTVFRGIPYACLPARFTAPGPVDPWPGVRPATAFGPPPPQSAALGPTVGAGGDPADGEDWLTVNVWTPDPDGRRPVMVWIQGGAYAFGTSGRPEYDGAVLAGSGVVLVTFNYRVGLEGFGLVPGTPPNRGLLDQVAALTWVRDTIARFGGDPERVTVFGQSAGGGSVAALLAMPRAAGLFRRAIAQSVPGPFFTPALAADIARACAAELGVAVEGLPAVDPELLPVAGDAVLAGLDRHVDRWGAAAVAGVPFAPVVDGEVLPTTPWRGLTGRVDLLVGHTRDEQRLLSVLSGRLGTVTPEQASATAAALAPDPERYRQALPDPDRLDEVVRSDWLFRMPSLHLARAQLAAGGRAFLYELTWPASGGGGIFGACHGLDVPLVFGNLTAGQPAALIGEPGPAARSVSAAMRAAWTAFATTGDPGWPGYHTGLVRLFDEEPAVVPYPEQLSARIWRDPPDVLDLVPPTG